jgi:hypothetical protein
MWLDIDESLLNDVKAEEVVSGSGVLDSGIYAVKVTQAFLRQTESGAVMLEMQGKTESDASVFYSTCVKSGDAKGNKATYTDKKGNEQLLPGIVSLKHLFSAVGLDIKTESPEPAKVLFKDAEIDAKVFKGLKDKKFKACVRQYENEYNGDINIKYDIENFLDVNGNNSDGVSMEDKFLAKIEKSPIKLLKKAKAPTNATADAAAAASGW